MSGLIRIQTVRHPDGIEKIQHSKSKIWQIIKCEVIINAILENPNPDQNTVFRKYVILNPLDCTLTNALYF